MNLEGRNQKGMRLENLMRTLRILVFQGACSRRDLAQQLGLSKMSITNIINTFLSVGLVVEVDSHEVKPSTSGPKPVLLKVAAGKLVAIGIHITEYFINGQLYDAEEGAICEKKVLIDNVNSKTQFMNSIKEIVDQLVECAKSKNISIAAIGITDNYFINREEGSVVFKGNQLGIDDNYLKNNLKQRYSLPIFLEHERMGLLLTEMAYGLYNHSKKYYFLAISNEIRGDFTSGYNIQKGCVGLSGMVGHMSIKCDGPRCSCGNRGCYEQYGSMEALLKDSNCSSIKEFNSSLANREPSALRALESFIQVTTIAITNLVNLYDPEAVVITGSILELDSSVLKKIEYLVNNSIVFRKQRSISIIPSQMREKDFNKGAAILAFYEMAADKDYINSLCGL